MFKHVIAGRNGTIYAINHHGDLLWFRYLGFQDGSIQWERTTGIQIGSGWGEFHRVMASNDGVIYAIHPNGDLYWYRHLGHETGEGTWANSGTGLLVGSDWGPPARITVADDGVLYLLRENGELVWYRHTGFKDGTKAWATPTLVHSGFGQFDAVEASSDGVLYCRKHEYDELYWYKHLGYQTGANSWADFKHVGTGWNGFGRFTVSNAGVFYVVTSTGNLRWYQHTGFTSGAMSWQQADLESGFGAQVALMNSGSYLSADPSRGNQLFCASSTVGDNTRFRLIYLTEKVVALQAPSGLYAGVDTGTAGAPLFANRTKIGTSEKFTLKPIVLEGRTVYEITASNGGQLILDWSSGAGLPVLANSQPGSGYPAWVIEDRTPTLSLAPPILANMPALREVWTERLETGVWTDPYYNHSTRTYQEAYAQLWRQLYVGFVAYDAPQRGTIPIYRETRTVGGRTLCRLSSVAVTQPYPDGWQQVGVAFHAFASQMLGTVPVYREDDRDGNHFYSVRPKEVAEMCGWTQRGVAFYAYPADILRPYPRVVIKDAATERYVHLDGSTTHNLVARRAAIGGGEPFSVVYLGHGRLALQASTGMYVSAASGSGLVANSAVITRNETFACYEATQLAHWNDQRVPQGMSLLAANGKWLSVDSAQGGALVATSTTAPTSQSFPFLTQPVPSTTVGAEALSEVYEDASVNGPNLFKYTTDAPAAAGWERRGVAFAAYSTAQPGTVPIYLETPSADPDSRFHLWHRTVDESAANGWVQQRVAFHAFMWQAPGTIPVYRDEKNYRFQFSTRSDVAAAEAGFQRWDIAFYAYPAEAMQQRFVTIRNPIMNLILQAQDGRVLQNMTNDVWPGRHIEVRPEPSGGVRLLCHDRKHIYCDETGALQITTDPTLSSGVFEIEPLPSGTFRIRASSGKLVSFGPSSSDFQPVKAETQAVLQSGSGYRWDQHAVFEWIPYASALVPLEVEQKVPDPTGLEPDGAEVRQRIVTALSTAPSEEQQILNAALAFLDQEVSIPDVKMRISVNPNLVAGLLISLNKEAVRVASMCAGGIDWRSYANADENPIWVQFKTLMMLRKAYKVKKLLDEFKDPKNAKMAKSTKFLKLFKAIVGGPLKVYLMTAGTAMIELSAADIAQGGAGGCQILMPWSTPGIFIPFPPGFVKEDEQLTWQDLARATNPYAQQFIAKVNQLYTQSESGVATGSNWIKSMYVTEAAKVTEMLHGIGNTAFATSESAAKSLKSMGYGATEAVQGIVSVYNTNAQQTANILKSAGYAGEQIASSIKGTYDITQTGVEQTIQNAGIGLDTAVTTVGSGLTAGATTVGSWISGLFRV